MNERLQALGNGISRRVTDYLGTQRPISLAIHFENEARASAKLEEATRALQTNPIKLEETLGYLDVIAKYAKVLTEPVKTC